MRLLEKTEINLVNPKFRQAVLDAWNRGEGVPYSITLLSETKPTRKDIKRAKELMMQYKWESK